MTGSLPFKTMRLPCGSLFLFLYDLRLISVEDPVQSVRMDVPAVVGDLKAGE